MAAMARAAMVLTLMVAATGCAVVIDQEVMAPRDADNLVDVILCPHVVSTTLDATYEKIQVRTK